jgi:hypothetical protein
MMAQQSQQAQPGRLARSLQFVEEIIKRRHEII